MVNPTDNRRPITFIRKLDTVGDMSGDTDMAVDGSTVNAIYRIKPAAGQIFQVVRIMVYVEDNASFDSGGWGALGGTPLTNGCLLRKVQNSVTFDGVEMKSNGELSSIMYDVNHQSYGAGNEFLVGRLTFSKFGGDIRLKGDNADELQFIIRDNLTGLAQQYIYAEGWIENTLY